MASCTRCTRLSTSARATPSRAARSATATATVAEETRRLATSGSSGAPGADTSASPVIASAAACSIPSVTRLARATTVPSPSPGYTSALLAWPMTWVVPSRVTGGTGMPAATSARPPVQDSTSAGIASIFSVGLDSGSTIGRSTCRAIPVTTCSVNAPALVEVPTRTVGRTRSTTAARSVSAPSHSDTSRAGRAYGTW